MSGLLHREMFKVIIRGRARNGRNLKDFIGEKDTNEDMAEAARHRTKRTRYPGDLDAPGREYSQSQESSEYNETK